MACDSLKPSRSTNSATPPSTPQLPIQIAETTAAVKNKATQNTAGLPG